MAKRNRQKVEKKARTARKKPNFNFSMPVLVADAFNAAARRFGPKRRWSVCSAAVLLFLELPPQTQDMYVRQVFTADLIPGQMAKLLASARRRVSEARAAAAALRE